MTLDEFISPQDQHKVTSAIADAERQSSGEIRVHVTPRCRFSVMKAAKRVFNKQRMYLTRHRNGVLIYIAPLSRKLAILGDSGINDLVPENYWDDELALLSQALASGDVVAGIVETVKRIGAKLSEFFPPEEGDDNELSDEISFEA